MRQGGGRFRGKRGTPSLNLLSRGGQADKKVQKFPPLYYLVRPHRADMPCKLWLLLSVWLLLPFSEGGRQMPKLSDKKLCADSECSRKYNYVDCFRLCASIFFSFCIKTCITQSKSYHNFCTCTDPILIARALQDYYPGDCRFIHIRQGQLIYVYAMLKDRGNLFWAGSVSCVFFLNAWTVNYYYYFNHKKWCYHKLNVFAGTRLLLWTTGGSYRPLPQQRGGGDSSPHAGQHWS